jgi:hypothetical protein
MEYHVVCGDYFYENLKEHFILLNFLFFFHAQIDSWELWNAFRLLCEHHNQPFVALDIL